MAAIADLTGLWRRDLLVWPGQADDVTTSVHWLQGPGYYADLRRPAGRPDMASAACLRDLTAEQLVWLARQEGFAGDLSFDGTWFTWARDLDVQPDNGAVDAGRLWFEGERLIEAGRHVAYVEHWRREPCGDGPSAAVRLEDPDGPARAYLIRVGALFIYARSRPAAIAPGSSLAAALADAATLRDAQDLVDCEVSFGRITAEGWVIAHSSLPFREGAVLTTEAEATPADGLDIADLTADGEGFARRWRIAELRGAADDLRVRPPGRP